MMQCSDITQEKDCSLRVFKLFVSDKSSIVLPFLNLPLRWRHVESKKVAKSSSIK